MICLGEETILGFVEGRLSQEELARVEAHTRVCSSCDELVAAALQPSLPRGASSPRTIDPGARIGRYTVLQLIGVGGMSEVYAAYDPELDRKIALKVLRQSDPQRPGHDESRLLREARAVASLRHPNVIKVYDVGTSGSRVFIAMEHVDGQTLSDWLGEKPRTWREILPVFVDAARGLGAAHAARLVHRDFKPQNVMIDREGLVHVMDFGLARRLDGAATTIALDAEGATGLIQRVHLSTGTGGIVGTPPYMAPEQLRAEAADARSDQFSFCVALYQALYGVHPFLDDASAGTIAEVMTAGRLRPPPSLGAVPSWLRRATVRGLSPRPEERWPSMSDLVAALRPRRIGAGRWWGTALGFGAVAMIAGVSRVTRQKQQLCQGGPARLADAWNLSGKSGAWASRRDAVRSAFLVTGLPAAAENWDRASVLLDGFAQQWLGLYREACEATNVRGEQSAEALDLRMACLDDRHAALKALTDLLAQASPKVVTHAVDAVNQLPPLERCADLRLLRAVGPPLPGGAIGARVSDIRQRAMQAKALFDTGGQQRASSQAEGLVAEARALGYTPLLAEMLLMAGNMETPVPQPNRAATLREAAQIGVQIRRDDIVAEAYTLLAAYAVLNGRTDDAAIWSEIAEAHLDRIGPGQTRLRSWLINDRANALVLTGDYEGARRLFDQALSLKRTLMPPAHPDVLRTLSSQAENLYRMGRPEEALELNRNVLRSLVVAYGSRSPFVAGCLNNQGDYLLALGRPTEALQVFKDSLARWEAGQDAAHPFVAYPLTGIGRALLALGQPLEARIFLERALKFRTASGVDPTLRKETGLALAQALRVTGERTRAAEVARSVTPVPRSGTCASSP